MRTTEEQTKQVAIEFRQEYKPDSDMYVGEKRIEVRGQEGTKAVTQEDSPGKWPTGGGRGTG